MNGSRDIMFKRRGCMSEETGRQLAGECPRLAEPGHGSWYYAVQVTTVGGRKARYRRDGFATREAAVAARQVLLDDPSAFGAKLTRLFMSGLAGRRRCREAAGLSWI